MYAAATKRELNVADRNTTSSDRKSPADALASRFFSRTGGADFHETWYVASGTPAHHSLFK